jgi:cytochrome c553
MKITLTVDRRIDMTGLLLAVVIGVLMLGASGTAGAGPLDQAGYVKVVTCSACHGFNGNSREDAVPILAGMAPAYFRKTIEDYAAGRRVSAEMEPIAKQVKLLGVDEVAAFFAAQRREPAPTRPDGAAVERGRAAAAQCATCHGAQGQGDPARLVPRIAGQPAGYLRNQLLLFKADRRSPGDEALATVKAVLRAVPDETLADLAAYYSGLR